MGLARIERKALALQHISEGISRPLTAIFKQFPLDQALGGDNGSFRISGKQNIEIVKLFAGRRIVIDAIKYFNDDIYTPSIVIGQNVSISDDIHIACTNKIKIDVSSI